MARISKIITVGVGVAVLCLLSATPSLGQSQSRGSRKIVCLDNRGDVTSSLWTATGVEIGAATTVNALPKGFGDLKALSSGSNEVWYMEGPSTGSKDITFKSPLNLYPSRARSVSIYIKYYTNSGRRLSLYPVKEGSGAGGSSPSSGTLQLLPLPSKGSLAWIEVRKEIDPTEFPLEITSHLSSKEVLIFDKIVVAVDTPLPTDLGISCAVMRTPLVLGSPSTGQGQIQGSPWPTTATTRSGPNIGTPMMSQCPPTPVLPECKCNCLCNCSKC